MSDDIEFDRLQRLEEEMRARDQELRARAAHSVARANSAMKEHEVRPGPSVECTPPHTAAQPMLFLYSTPSLEISTPFVPPS